MAVRKLLGRHPGRKVTEGIFAGLENLGQGLIGIGTRDKQQKEILDRATLNDLRDNVISGKLDPDQATAAAQSQKIKVPGGFFETLRPSVQSELQKSISNINCASNKIFQFQVSAYIGKPRSTSAFVS